MSWHFSRALAEAYSAGICSAGEPSAPSSTTPTPAMYFLPGRTTDAFRRSQSGMMCAPLTADRGEAVLTSFLAAFPAKTFPPPEGALESKERKADSGGKWRALSVKYDPVSRGWKTHHCLWDEDLDWSCLTLPRWGMMQSGALWARITPPPLTRGIESGYWPTPRAAECHGEKHSLETSFRHWQEGRQACLSQMVRDKRMFPTPCATEARQGYQNRHNGKKGRQESLSTVVRGGTAAWAGGQLNPTWVEWLMGWPIGWTDCAVSAMDRFRQWCASHGVS